MTIQIGKRIAFRVWFINHFNFSPIDLSISRYHIDFFTRWFFVVIELEISTESFKQHGRNEQETDGTA